MTEFADNLRKRANALGISHAELADRAGLTPRAFSHYVTGQREPNLAALIRISIVVGATHNELLGLDEKPSVRATDRERIIQRIHSACVPLAASELQLVEAVVQAMVGKLPSRFKGK